ncbi:CRP/FNR family transcriptional regulator, anaerobic regulatory protein [Paenibacillus sp. CF384]|nr:CRP/FNR family transcriptional regulator, anaerobic regulatory protein [Paenibacillus sp. CF384]
MYKITSEGKQFTVGILSKGNVFGEIDTFSFGTKGLYIETIKILIERDGMLEK